MHNNDLGTCDKKKHNEELYCLCGKPNILTHFIIGRKRSEWLGHIWRANGNVLENVLTEKTNEKRPLGRPRTRRKDTVEKDRRLIEGSSTEEMDFGQ